MNSFLNAECNAATHISGYVEVLIVYLCAQSVDKSIILLFAVYLLIIISEEVA